MLPARSAGPDRRLCDARQGRGRAPQRVQQPARALGALARAGDPVAWGAADAARPALYPVDVQVEAADRQGLLRDVLEVFAKDKINVTGVKSNSVRDASGGTAFMTLTVDVADAARLAPSLAQVCRVAGVRTARRR